jgi:hypothetical protein
VMLVEHWTSEAGAAQRSHAQMFASSMAERRRPKADIPQRYPSCYNPSHGCKKPLE